MKRKIKTVISLFLAVALVSGLIPWNKLDISLTAHAQETSQCVSEGTTELPSDHNGSAFSFVNSQSAIEQIGDSLGEILETLFIMPIVVPVMLLFFVPMYLLSYGSYFLSSIGVLDKIPDDVLILITTSILRAPLSALVICLAFYAALLEGPSSLVEFFRLLLGGEPDDIREYESFSQIPKTA